MRLALPILLPLLTAIVLHLLPHRSRLLDLHEDGRGGGENEERPTEGH